MKGNQAIIEGLNELLSYELAAMDQYFSTSFIPKCIWIGV